MKRILILTAGFGEGHNSAARGVRAGLARIAPKVEVELRDLFPETFGVLNEIIRRAYLGEDQAATYLYQRAEALAKA